MTGTRQRSRVCIFSQIRVIVGSLLFFTCLLYRTQYKSIMFSNINKNLKLSTERNAFIQTILKIQKDLEQINRTQNDQNEWRKHVEERMIKQANPYVILDAVKADFNEHSMFIVLVSSNAPHFKRRKLIRRTWGNHTMWTTKENWKVLFVLGGTEDKQTLQMIQQEAETYKDIMLEDVSEGFYQLSYKVMIGLTWAYSTFKFDFILKCDDDIFVQIDRIASKLTNEYKNEGYIGNVMAGTPVLRKGRYGVSKKEREKDSYDPYCSGGGFILSHNTIGKIIPLFNWKSPLKIDDAYFGELVFQIGVKALHVHGFYMSNGWCEYNDHLLISHPVKKQECMEFLLNHSLIDNGRLVNDTIKNRKNMYGPK